MNAQSKYKGSIKLSAIADALGWMTEFESSASSITKKFGTDYITSFYDWEKKVGGRFHGYTDNIKAGSYSDDTQLMLCVARSMKSDGKFDRRFFSKVELANWLSYSRGAGRTIKNAADKIQRKSAKWNNNFFKFKAGKSEIDYRDSGANGAAMRVLPIALVNFDNHERLKEEIFANSIITHGHPRAILGAILYGYAIDKILRFEAKSFDYLNFLTMLGKDIHHKLSLPFLNKSDYSSWLFTWNNQAPVSFQEVYNSTLNEVQNHLREVWRCIKDLKDDKDCLTLLGCFDKDTKGSGTATVIAGIFFACKYANQPVKGIEKAVNSLGSDTDSIASFAGGLLGSLHGQSIIPAKWKSVQDFSYLDRVAESLLALSQDEEALVVKTDLSKELKSVNDITQDDIVAGESVYFDPLGKGTVINIDRQDTLTRGQYNLIIEIKFDLGQSCIISKLLKHKSSEVAELSIDDSKSDKYDLSSIKLDSSTQKKVKNILNKLSPNDRTTLFEILLKISKSSNQ